MENNNDKKTNVEETTMAGKYLDPKEAPAELLENEQTRKALSLVEKSAMSEAQLYAFNHFFRLGYDIHDYLKDPVAKNFDEWFLSKQYKRKALDEELIKTKKTSDFCTAAVLNTNSALSLKFKEAFSKDALTSGWKPRSDFDIMLFHDTKDDVVPVDNYYAMKKFLDDNHIKTEGLVGDYSGEAKESLGTTNHEASAATFFLKIIEWMTKNYK